MFEVESYRIEDVLMKRDQPQDIDSIVLMRDANRNQSVKVQVSNRWLVALPEGEIPLDSNKTPKRATMTNLNLLVY